MPCAVLPCRPVQLSFTVPVSCVPQQCAGEMVVSGCWTPRHAPFIVLFGGTPPCHEAKIKLLPHCTLSRKYFFWVSGWTLKLGRLGRTLGHSCRCSMCGYELRANHGQTAGCCPRSSVFCSGMSLPVWAPGRSALASRVHHILHNPRGLRSSARCCKILIPAPVPCCPVCCPLARPRAHVHDLSNIPQYTDHTYYIPPTSTKNDFDQKVQKQRQGDRRMFGWGLC